MLRFVDFSTRALNQRLYSFANPSAMSLGKGADTSFDPLQTLILAPAIAHCDRDPEVRKKG